MQKYLLFIIIISNFSYSQGKEKKVKVDGSIELSYDTYNYYTENYSSFRPRSLNDILKLNTNINVAFGKNFSIPFGINITNQKTAYNLPNLPEENLFNYVQNPRNNIHIDPKYKWFQSHLGSHTPN